MKDKIWEIIEIVFLSLFLFTPDFSETECLDKIWLSYLRKIQIVLLL